MITAALGAIPFFGNVLKLMDQLEKLKVDDFREAEFELWPGLWAIAWVSHEWEEGGEWWCSLHVPIQLYPGGFYISKIKRSSLRFTDRKAWQTFLTSLSGGIIR